MMPSPRATFVVLFACLGPSACDVGKSPARERESVVRVPKVVVEHAKRTPYEHDMVLAGTLEPFERAEIYGQVAGYLDTVEVDIGDTVAAGDVLARIFAPEVGAEVQRAQASLVATRTQIKQFEEAKQLAELERERRQNLRAVERGAIAQQDVDVAAAGAEMAGAELASAEASAARARAELAKIRARKQFAVVRAPFGGRVTKRMLHPGALIRETTSSAAVPVVELQRVNPVRVVFDVPDTIAANVAVGHELELTYDTIVGRKDVAKVTRIAGALDTRTRTMRVEADLLNDDGALLPGLHVRVRVRAVSIPEALTLASAALRGTGDERYVLAVEDDKLVRNPVRVVTDSGKRAVVAEGIDEKTAVVVAGSPLAVEGGAVDVAEVRK